MEQCYKCNVVALKSVFFPCNVCYNTSCLLCDNICDKCDRSVCDNCFIFCQDKEDEIILCTFCETNTYNVCEECDIVVSKDAPACSDCGMIICKKCKTVCIDCLTTIYS